VEEKGEEIKESTENKKTLKFIVGFICLVALSIVINLAISLKLIFPENIIEWVSGSSNPITSLWIISILVASAMIILFQTGAKLPFLKLEIPKHPLFSYVFGLPVWATSSVFVVAIISLAVFQPVCQSPTATVNITSLDEDALIQYDGESIHAKVGANLTLKAIPGDNAVTFCSWSSVGSAVNSIGPTSSCTTQLHLSNQPGREVITLTLSKSFCSVKSMIPLELIVEPYEEEEE
jgi:hypothetical protein